MLNLTLVSLALRDQYGFASLRFQSNSNLRIEKSIFSRWFSSSVVGSYREASVTHSSFLWFLGTAVKFSRDEKRGDMFTSRQQWEERKVIISECAFRNCKADNDSDGGGFSACSDEIVCTDNAFVSCVAGYGAGFSWNGTVSVFERNCLVDCYAEYQMNAFIIKAEAGLSMNYTVVHECSADFEKATSNGVFFASGFDTGRMTFYHNNVTRCIISDIKAAASFDHLSSCRSSFVIYRNTTSLRLMQVIGSSETDTLEFDFQHICYTKVGYTNRVPCFFDYEGHIVIRNSIFFHNQKKFQLAHMRQINKDITSTLTVIGCTFDHQMKTDGAVTWGPDNTNNVNKPPPSLDIDFANWQCRTSVRTPPPTASPEPAPPTESPHRSDLPQPSAPSIAPAATTVALEEIEEHRAYSMADMAQVGGLAFLVVVTAMVFISARIAKEKKMAKGRNEEKAAFIIRERENQPNSVL